MPSNQDFNQRLKTALRAVVIGLCINVILAAIKIISGIIGNSYALIADGIESTLDIFSSLIVFVGMKISARPADKNHPFGHGRAETLSALIVSAALMAAAIVIAVKSIAEIHNPHHAPAPFTLIVLVGVVVIKESLFRRVLTAGDSVNSLSLKTDAWHHRSDALTSLAAFIGISVALIMGHGYESADDWAAVGASVIIAFNGLRLLQHTIQELMDHAPSPHIEEEIRTIAGQIPGVFAIEKCRVRKSGTQLFVDIHVEVDGEMSVRQAHDIAHHVKDILLTSSLGIADALVHIEPAQHQ